MFGLILKLLAIIVSLTMLDFAPVGDGLAYLDIVLCDSAMFSDYTSSKSTPNSYALCLTLPLRFQRVIHSTSRSSTNNSDGLPLVINQQNSK